MTENGIIKFQLANIQFGIFADHILEIVRLGSFREIPMPLPYIIGLTQMRDYIVVIADLRKRLGLTPLPLNPSTTMIVAKFSTGMIGVLVESISHFKQLAEKEILPPFSIAGFPADLLHGIVTEQDEIILLPDLDKLFSSYIHVQLLPITQSEKVAFQYRTFPGGITRTLEHTLMQQHYLDENMIRKISRAMSVSSVQLHKISSYYRDFQPQRVKENIAPDAGQRHFQDARAGDETYLSLSKRLSSQHAPRPGEPSAPKPQHDAAEPELLLLQDTAPFPRMLEAALHDLPAAGVVRASGAIISGREAASQKEIGRMIAKALRLPSVKLRRYFTYYPQPESPRPVPREQAEAAPQTSAAMDDATVEQWLRACAHARLRLEDALRLAQDRGYVLTFEQMRRVAAQYQTPLARIARLCEYFPKVTIIVSAAAPEEEAMPETAEQPAHVQSAVPARAATPDAPAPKTLKEWLDGLADGREAAPAAMRLAAARLRLPTCRLNALQRYYGHKESLMTLP